MSTLQLGQEILWCRLKKLWRDGAQAPFDQASDSSGVSLSLTKALVEANRAQFHLKTGAHMGTLIEVVFGQEMARA